MFTNFRESFLLPTLELAFSTNVQRTYFAWFFAFDLLHARPHAVYIYHAWLKHSSLATLFCVCICPSDKIHLAFSIGLIGGLH